MPHLQDRFSKPERLQVLLQYKCYKRSGAHLVEEEFAEFQRSSRESEDAEHPFHQAGTTTDT